MNFMKNKLSSREIKLIIIVTALGILMASYRFVYYPNTQNTKKIQDEIKQLKVREDDLQLKNAKADEVEEKNIVMTKEINRIINRYGAGATIQKTIIFLESMEQVSDMDISVISFEDPKIIFSDANGGENIQTVDNSSSGDNLLSDNTSTSDNSDLNDEKSLESSDTLSIAGAEDKVSGYNSVVSIDFKVSSEGLKKCIDYINNQSERKNIKEINIVYDMETGNLNGTMLINMYQLTDTGKIYTDPAIAGVSIGTRDIFGTIGGTADTNN